MADKTLYDILELDYSATPETIAEAYARLSARYDPSNPQNAGSDEAKIQHAAVKDAHFVLANPERRAHYDSEVRARMQAYTPRLAVAQRHWTLSKVLLLAVAIAGAGIYYHRNRQEAMQQEIAAAQAGRIARAAAMTQEAQLSDEADGPSPTPQTPVEPK